MALCDLILRLWARDSEVIVRCHSVLLGAATITMVCLLEVRSFKRRVGLIMAPLITVHAFHIRWSQEARGYAMPSS